MKKRLILAVAAATILAASFSAKATAAADNQPRSDFSLPPYAGAYQPQGVDEQGLWMLADEGERLLRDSPLVIQDESLNNYIRAVLCRAVGADRCASTRIYVMRVPYFNASMTPNGTMRVYSGLLLRVRNEAELASVLGHEFAHFEMRHTLQDFRRQRSASDFLAWSALLGAFAQRYGSGTAPNYSDMRLSVFGTLAQFNRDQEREADVRGFSYMTVSQFRPSAAADVWRSVMNESDASAVSRGRRPNRYDGVAFLASHPSNLERADYLSGLANRIPSPGDYDGREAYRAAMAPWFAEFLSDQVKLNDFGGTEFLLARLASEGWTAELLHARGELYRTRGNPRDLVNAADFYRQALTLDPSMAVAQRGLGLSLIRSGQPTEGKAVLEAYLAANPEAPDAAMMRSLIQF